MRSFPEAGRQRWGLCCSLWAKKRADIVTPPVWTSVWILLRLTGWHTAEEPLVPPKGCHQALVLRTSWQCMSPPSRQDQSDRVGSIS